VDSWVGAADVLALCVAGAAVIEVRGQLVVAPILVGHDAGFAGDVCADNRDQSVGVKLVDHHAASAATGTVNERQHSNRSRTAAPQSSDVT